MLVLLPTAALLLQLPATAAAAPARSIVNFDFGWRFSFAQEQRYLAQCTFVENMNYGEGNIAAVSTSSKEACCSECANREGCLSWDWTGSLCYLKDNARGGKAGATVFLGGSDGGGGDGGSDEGGDSGGRGGDGGDGD